MEWTAIATAPAWLVPPKEGRMAIPAGAALSGEQFEMRLPPAPQRPPESLLGAREGQETFDAAIGLVGLARMLAPR